MTTTDRNETMAVRVNGNPVEVRSRVLTDLLRELGHDPARPGIAVSLNDEVVPRGRWTDVAVDDGDRVEIVGAVQGG